MAEFLIYNEVHKYDDFPLCPFCGGVLKLRFLDGGDAPDNNGGFIVDCSTSNCCQLGPFKTQKEVEQLARRRT